MTCGLSTHFRHGRSRGGRRAVGAARRTQGGCADARGVHFAHARQDRRLRRQPGFYRERSYQVRDRVVLSRIGVTLTEHLI
jgi:hypothetical protein